MLVCLHFIDQQEGGKCLSKVGSLELIVRAFYYFH